VQVASFLGWTRKAHNDNTVQPDAKCELTFETLDLFAEGLLQESQIKGLNRQQREHRARGGDHEQGQAAAGRGGVAARPANG
jgi:hypothetical protein